MHHNRTDIFKAAKQHGVNVHKKLDVEQFIKDYAPSLRVKRKAWDIAFLSEKPDYSRYTPNTNNNCERYPNNLNKYLHSQ